MRASNLNKLAAESFVTVCPFQKPSASIASLGGVPTYSSGELEAIITPVMERMSTAQPEA